MPHWKIKAFGIGCIREVQPAVRVRRGVAVGANVVREGPVWWWMTVSEGRGDFHGIAATPYAAMKHAEAMMRIRFYGGKGRRPSVDHRVWTLPTRYGVDFPDPESG